MTSEAGGRDSLIASVELALAANAGRRVQVRSRRSVSGGSIYDTGLWQLADGRTVFVKTGDAVDSSVFAREAEGLRALEATGALRVPEVLAVGAPTPGQPAFLVLEAIVEGRRGPRFFEDFGSALAALHRAPAASAGPAGEPFGLAHDNHLGATPQPNPWTQDWVEFWRHQRLGHQLDLARRRGLSDPTLDRLGDRLLDRLDDLLAEPDEPAALLHGDLWGGNYLADDAGQAVLIDPAVYYGRREADLAMTRLFGGFTPRFYAAYEEAWPLAPGSETRLTVYELYHLLNHLNLFGGGYRGQCLARLRGLGLG